MDDSAPPMVAIDNVSKRFGDTVAVREASLSVARGEFLTILGPSGCGKTTLLRMVAGFDVADGGRIEINGADVSRIPPHRRAIGMVFQRLALFPHMTAAQNVAYPLKMRGFAKHEIPDRVDRFLELVRLHGLGERRPHELSGGQQQRVAIARALSFGPDLLLLDEPLSALDKKLREDMQLEFRRIQQDLSVTTINVTHDQREALVMSDKIIVMEGGIVRQADTPRAVYQMPQSRFVATFIGVTSTFEARVSRCEGEAVFLKAGTADLIGRSIDTLGPGESVECTLRAERARLLSDGEAAENVLHGVLVQTVFEGDRVVYAVAIPALGDAHLLVFDHDPGATDDRPEGSSVALGFAARDLIAFAHSQSLNENEKEPSP